jgi:hypothetical protein
VIDQLDWLKLTSQYAGKGFRPFYPKMLLAMPVYGDATGGCFQAANSSKRPMTQWRFVSPRPTSAYSIQTVTRWPRFDAVVVGDLSGVCVQLLAMTDEKLARRVRPSKTKRARSREVGRLYKRSDQPHIRRNR